jgi:hypothetical protein
METAFPFGLPLPTAFYLTVYIITLVIHVVFMNYVLAGTAALAASYLRPGNRGNGESAAILREWMPLMLSGAITAGVAPLLFLQILYKQGYYTANLLLFNRWMAILPVLIVGFYALYLLKSKWLTRRAGWIAAAVAVLPILCVAFTGYSWTENHLLSVRSPAFWGEFYATRAQIYHDPQLFPRLLVWAVGSIPTLVIILAWQHWYRGTGQPGVMARAAGIGLVLVTAATAWYYLATDDHTRQALVSPFATPYFAAACLGLLVQAVGWGWIGFSRSFDGRKLIIPSLGLVLTVVGMTVCREAVRIAAIGPERFASLFPGHAEAFGKGGLFVFLGFFAINAVLVVLVFWLVRNHSVTKTGQNNGSHSLPGT